MEFGPGQVKMPMRLIAAYSRSGSAKQPKKGSLETPEARDMSASRQTGLRDIRASTGDGFFSSLALLPGHVTGTNCKLQPCGSQAVGAR